MKQLPLKRSGFTIVELIVVIVVIAILAALTIVSYNEVVRNTKVKATEADALGIAAALTKYKASQGTYPTSIDLLAYTPENASTFQYAYDAANNSYCLTASVSGASSYVKSGSTKVAEGGCPGHGVNGLAAVTNLTPNPSFEVSMAGAGGYYSSPTAGPTADPNAVAGSSIGSTTTNSTVNRQGIILPVSTSAKANQAYTCSVYLRGTNGATVTFSGRFSTAASAYISEGGGAKSITLSSTDWTRVSASFTTPANTGILQMQAIFSVIAAGQLLEFDALMCAEGSTDYNFADGNTANWIWSGAADLSSSTGPRVE